MSLEHSKNTLSSLDYRFDPFVVPIAAVMSHM